jgi:hypothetical protein
MGYTGVRDYIVKRAADFGYNTYTLSPVLGFGVSYLNAVVNGQFMPSTKRCRKISDFFGDDPNILLELAGYYEPPPEEDPLVREIVQIANRLPHHLKRYLMLQARFLRSIEEELVVNPESAVAYVELPGGRVIDVPAEGIPVDLDEESVRKAIREALEKKAGE